MESELHWNSIQAALNPYKSFACIDLILFNCKNRLKLRLYHLVLPDVGGAWKIKYIILLLGIFIETISSSMLTVMLRIIWHKSAICWMPPYSFGISSVNFTEQ